jgi:dTDP-4-dehydrorhamnose 3,5-epimerase
VRVVQTDIPGVLVIEPDVHRDPRGYFLETFHAAKYQAAGIDGPFVQDNQSRSLQGTVRGLHLQRQHPQGKLIRVVEGAIYDVAVDVRRGSPTFGRWVAITLSAENFLQCYIPPHFAHGFCVTTPVAQVEYKCTDIYHPASELGIAWNDPTLAIRWPVRDAVVSARDSRNPVMADVVDALPAFAQSGSSTDL